MKHKYPNLQYINNFQLSSCPPSCVLAVPFARTILALVKPEVKVPSKMCNHGYVFLALTSIAAISAPFPGL
jgi:hypothetical protein